MREIVAGSGNVSRLMDEISSSTSEQEKEFHRLRWHYQSWKGLRKAMWRWRRNLTDPLTLRNQVIELQSRTRNFRLDGDTRLIVR